MTPPLKGSAADSEHLGRSSARKPRPKVLVQDAFQCLSQLDREASELRKHLYVSAIFFADQLVSLKPEPETIYTLAECYFKNREYRRSAPLKEPLCAQGVCSTC